MKKGRTAKMSRNDMHPVGMEAEERGAAGAADLSEYDFQI